jgi:hypothetical protein
MVEEIIEPEKVEPEAEKKEKTKSRPKTKKPVGLDTESRYQEHLRRIKEGK